MLLSDEKKSEIHAQWLTRSIGIDSVIEIIEAAILEKLASAELPEPVVQRTKESKEKTLDDWFYASNPAYAKVHSSWKWEGLFTAAQFQQAHAQGFAAGSAAQIIRLGEKDGPNT